MGHGDRGLVVFGNAIAALFFVVRKGDRTFILRWSNNIWAKKLNFNQIMKNTKTCHHCEGKGFIELRDCSGEIQREEICSFCEGMGTVTQSVTVKERRYSILPDHTVQTKIEKAYSARLVEKKLFVKISISAVSTGLST